MVYNCFIKCQVCGSITRVRLQVGYQEEHPIVVICGKCGTSLSGRVEFYQDTTGFRLDFDNADIINKDNYADYMVECSGEFPTFKQCTAVTADDIIITPFIRAMSSMKNDDSREQFARTLSQLNMTADKWKDYRRILDLFQNKSEYLVQEIKKQFEGKYFECRDEYEVLRAVHIIEVRGFYSPLRKDMLDNLSFSSDILKLDSGQMKKMIYFLNAHEGYHLDEMQALIYKLYDEFIGVYKALIPALFLQFCKEDAYNFDLEGSTTSTYNTIKQFYLNVYEALGNLLIIPVALNNIKYRANVETLPLVEKNVTSLNDFIELTKATRYHFYQKNEMYTKFLNIIVNPKLRNAIGHNDVEYDTVSQIITYIPNSKDRTKKKTEYLLEFENEAMLMFQGVLAISEYLYRLRELELMHEGKVPDMARVSTNNATKIGRNDPCPCGSGRKYKFCHGLS